MNRPALITLNHMNLSHAQLWADALDADLYVKQIKETLPHPLIGFDETMVLLPSLFLAKRPIIFIGSVGILMRALAPYLHNKHDESPILSMSADGKTIIPLIGLHHGGMALAKRLAAITDGQIACTNASMTSYDGVSLEYPPKGWVLNAKDQNITSLLASLAKESGCANINIADDLKDCDLSDIKSFLAPLTHDESASVKITISAKSEKQAKAQSNHIYYHPKDLILGIGAIRGADKDALFQFVQDELNKAHLPLSRVSAIASIAQKEDELAIKSLAKQFDCPFYVFKADVLKGEKRIQNPSEQVELEMNTPSVAEASALLLAGEGDLILPKVKTDFATMAIAQAGRGAFQKGKRVGKLSLVGLGPGPDAWRTPAASQALAEAEIIVGYDYYLKLIAPYLKGKTLISHELGEEEARCLSALTEAAKGAKVALISSGDIGIYAMAALVYELIDRPKEKGGVDEDTARVHVETIPGISAFQAASALSGAPMGHDFCTISLSDLMTPWSVIEKRVLHAAKGDFVIAFYNPQSKKRRHQLSKALNIISEYRGPDTPIFMGRQCGRKDEKLTHSTLAKIDIDAVDMLTILIIGSSQSRQMQRGDGLKLYTPRGYGDKIQH